MPSALDATAGDATAGYATALDATALDASAGDAFESSLSFALVRCRDAGLASMTAALFEGGVDASRLGVSLAPPLVPFLDPAAFFAARSTFCSAATPLPSGGEAGGPAPGS